MIALRSAARRPLVAAAAVTALLLAGTSCSVVDDLKGSEPVAAKPSAAAEVMVDSQFTRDGTYQSHIDYKGVDFVYNMYPTKATPRTNEWYPLGTKYFTFTFLAYDLDQDLRAPFAKKRKVYLGDIEVTSSTTLATGAPGNQQPYALDAKARDVTFDPEPVTTPRGMLITSPKGAFELRNQAIGEMSLDTRGLTLNFKATVFVQDQPGGGSYTRRTIKESVPIAIFASDQPTSAASIAIDAG